MDKWLCKTATSVCSGPLLKRALNRSTVCGVSEISGTRTMAPLPFCNACGDGLQINLRLAAAGHAVKKKNRLGFLRAAAGRRFGAR